VLDKNDCIEGVFFFFLKGESFHIFRDNLFVHSIRIICKDVETWLGAVGCGDSMYMN